jgi:predicted metalloprotease with PDZ domain
MLRPKTHYIDVKLEIPIPSDWQSNEIELMMPVWTPGHYFIEDFSRNILVVRAVDSAAGRELRVDKRSKNLWTVDLESSAKVDLEYSVYAFAYDDTKSYIDQIHALINGASVFLYPKGMEMKPVRLTLVPFPQWRRVSTGLERVSDWDFIAPNYDILVDSPIEVGNQEIVSFDVQGTKHEVSMLGAVTMDKEKFVSDVKAIVENTIPIFDHVPYKRYVFLLNFTEDAGGGLEHLNSTVCLIPRFRLFPKEEYDLMMGLISHEFFHTWNVKRLRPVGLGPFDYTTETYTKSLWIAEGVTSYYDDLILRRTGLYSVPEYLDAFAINVNMMKSLPGRKWQSAEEASFDTWIKFHKSDANSPNVTMSYYTQGAVIGWMLDMAIRRSTKGSSTLDDVMRRIYQATYVKEGRGYSDEEFEKTSFEVGGRDVKEIFDARVRGREDIDFDRYLGYSGLRLGARDQTGHEKAFLGVRLGIEGGRVMVKTTLAGSAAEAMGLAVNDEMIGVDGMRATSERLSFYVATRKPGERVRLAIARNGQLMELEGEVGSKPTLEYRIYPIKDATDEQKSIFRGWLNDEWVPELRYPEYVHSPDRKPSLDFI